MRQRAIFRLSHAIAVLIVSACDSTPTSPTVPPSVPVMPNTPPAPSYVTRRLSGVVRDGSNRGVANAMVTIQSGTNSKRTVTTDSNGFYETSADLNQNSVVPWQYVEVSKPGYEDTRNGALFRNHQDATADFSLFERVRLTGGSDTELSVTFDGPLCGFELEYACRRIEVLAPASGTLTIDLIAGDPSTVYSFGPVTYPMRNPSAQISRPVRAGETFEAEILLFSTTPWSGWRALTVRTSLVR